MISFQKSSRPALVAALFALCMNVVASAHAQLDYAAPAVGAQVDTRPEQVKITFDDEVQSSGTSIEVYDAAGKQVDSKDSTQGAKDKKVMTVTLPTTLPAGTYTVKWKALCMENHKTNGEFTFTFKPKK